MAMNVPGCSETVNIADATVRRYDQCGQGGSVLCWSFHCSTMSQTGKAEAAKRLMAMKVNWGLDSQHRADWLILLRRTTWMRCWLGWMISKLLVAVYKNLNKKQDAAEKLLLISRPILGCWPLWEHLHGQSHGAFELKKNSPTWSQPYKIPYNKYAPFRGYWLPQN